MTWAKLDDSFPEHLKVASLSDKAFRLHVTAICYAARNLTDGEIPVAQLPKLGGTSKLASELNAAGLWETTSRGGWVIHDYLEYNPSRSDVDAERERKRLAGQAGGLARAKALAKAGAKAGATPSATGNSGTPVPVPIPSASTEASHQRGASLPPLLRDRANTLALAIGDRWVDEETWDSIVQLCEEFSDFEIESAKRENRKVTPSRRPFPGNLREFLSKPAPRTEPDKKSVNDIFAEQEESERRFAERIKRDGIMRGGIPGE